MIAPRDLRTLPPLIPVRPERRKLVEAIALAGGPPPGWGMCSRAERAFLDRLGDLEWQDTDFEGEELAAVHRLRAAGYIGDHGPQAGHNTWKVYPEHRQS